MSPMSIHIIYFIFTIHIIYFIFIHLSHHFEIYYGQVGVLTCDLC